MADGKPGQEPSMEEILSSIRRIIAEDEGGDAAAAMGPRAQAAGPAGDEHDVLELTEVVSEPKGAPPASPRPAASAPPPRPAPARPEPAAREPRQESAPMPSPAAPPDAAETLISAETAKATALALARLTRATGGEERKASQPGSSSTVEQFLGELLAPLLRDWLDRNLPEIVERVVEQEVKKLARRAELL